MATHRASIKQALFAQGDLARRREHCSADPQTLAAIGCDVGQQVRIMRNDDEYGGGTYCLRVAT